tara:strand:- start:644 stop:931 length:288 start_codon:yes stop_codon:yes gene_type:complete
VSVCKKSTRSTIRKNIPFELATINYWHLNADIERFNPLVKIPVLIAENDGTIYDSKFITEWIELNYPDPLCYRLIKKQNLRRSKYKSLPTVYARP